MSPGPGGHRIEVLRESGDSLGSDVGDWLVAVGCGWLLTIGWLLTANGGWLQDFSKYDLPMVGYGWLPIGGSLWLVTLRLVTIHI